MNNNFSIKPEQLRNVAIVAHVDHGKTTLVDRLLQQTKTLVRKDQQVERILDSNDQEKERGITILAKNTAINWQDYRINIVDTPGHADFGGEVERILSMVDSVLLLVDAMDGPMPQTRFVTKKAFEHGLNPLVIINKVDRPYADPDRVLGEVFDLFDSLGATEEQLDFPVVYASALNGVAGWSLDDMAEDMTPIFELITKSVNPPCVSLDGPFQMQISALDYSNYLGVIGIGRISRGTLKPGSTVTLIDSKKQVRSVKIQQVMTHLGLERINASLVSAGDIVCITGVEPLYISDTLCDPQCVEALPALTIDEPTVSVVFQVNDSPFAGRDGKFISSRNIKERLEKELLTNVALRVEQGGDTDKFKVSGRGELHLAVLIEAMRREGYELSISRPTVVTKEIDGVMHEPYEIAVADIELAHQGEVIEEFGNRKGELQSLHPDNSGRLRLEYLVPSRGLIGLRARFLTLTSGTGILSSSFHSYAPLKAVSINHRQNGVLISMVKGKALAYALWNLQPRGRLFIHANTEVYEGQIIGLHNNSNDLTVNPSKGKQLTNIRAAGSDENILLTPPIIHSLEQAMDFIDDDELVEITPNFIRLRKKYLTEQDRKRAKNKV